MEWTPRTDVGRGLARVAGVAAAALLSIACDAQGEAPDGALDGASDGRTGGRLPDEGMSFELQATFEYDPACSRYIPWTPPATERFPVRLTPTGATVRMLVWRVGWLEPVELEADPDDPFLLRGGGLSMGGAPADGGFCTTTRPYWFESIDLRLLDRNGDTVADALAGSAAGMLYHQRNDVACEWRFEAQLEGLPDRRPPTVAAAYVEELHHPADWFGFHADEALPWELVGTLTVDGTDFATLVASSPDTVPEARIGYFPAETDRPPPFGVELGVRFSPELRDLAGNVAPSFVGPTFRTIPDPGVLAEDGFEGTVAAYMGGSARVVDGYGTLPAISGARSLLLEPDASSTYSGGRLTARLRMDAAVRRVAFRYRLLYAGSFGEMRFEGTARVVLPDAHVRLGIEFPDEPPGEVVSSGAATWDEATAVLDMSVALPSDAGSEAWLDIVLRDRPCDGRRPYATPAILLDDLRAE